MSTQQPVRVMFVVPDLRIGGAERHAVTLLPRLDPDRFTARLICIGSEGELFGELQAQGISAHALHRSKRQALRALVELRREMRLFAPDVVVTRGYSAESLGRIAAVWARVPHLSVWVHNCGDIDPRSRWRRICDKVLQPFTDMFLGVARAQTRYLTEDLGIPQRKIRVVHNGVEPHEFIPSPNRDVAVALGIPSHEPIVGIVAALRPEKDHRTLLRAARRVLAEVPETWFLVVGDGPERARLERFARELGIADRVVFTGARSDVRDVLRALDIFALTSSTVECFPIALLEAMATARPAVCTDVGGVSELLDEGTTGILVPPANPEALAEALLTLLRSPDLRWRFGQAARARVESSFTLTQSVAESERALEEAAGPPRSPVRLTLVLDRTFVGGIETVMLDVFRRLDRRLVLPRLVCLHEAGPLADDYRDAGIQVEVLDRRNRWDLTTLPKLIDTLRRDRTDAVLVTHHHRAALALGRIAAHAAGVRADLVAVHDMDLVSQGGRCLPRWTVASLWLADAMILLGHSQRDYLHAHEGVGRSRWSRTSEVVIPNGIAVGDPPTGEDRVRARQALDLGPEDFVVAVVARLSAQKAHHVLFEAFSKALPLLRPARLVVVGDGERMEELICLAEKLGIADRVLFVGTRRDVAVLLPGFDVTCLSSVHEAMPLAVLESMAAAVPVVATDCGCLSDLITDGAEGYLVPVGDVEGLADGLLALSRDPELRVQMGKRARIRVEQNFRIEDTARAYEQLLVETLGGQR